MTQILIGCALLLDASASQSIGHVKGLSIKSNGTGYKVYSCAGKRSSAPLRGLVVDNSRPLRRFVRK